MQLNRGGLHSILRKGHVLGSIVSIDIRARRFSDGAMYGLTGKIAEQLQDLDILTLVSFSHASYANKFSTVATRPGLKKSRYQH